MRDAAWAVHVPRALKERVLAVERAERALTARGSAAPTAEALAAEAGTQRRGGARGARSARRPRCGAARGARRRRRRAARQRDGTDRASRHATRRSSRRPIAVAEGRARRGCAARAEIVRLRFVEGLTQTEIAARVGLSQMQVSRLLRATLEALRGELD